MPHDKRTQRERCASCTLNGADGVCSVHGIPMATKPSGEEWKGWRCQRVTSIPVA